VLNEFMKLGQVVEVRGQKIRARVFENKNGPILLYKGDIIKNVSVGSFIKIPKGFISIIGKIEGEHISELREQNAAQRFQKESDSIERMIDISVLGVMEHGVFMKGMVEIPLVFSDVYILEEYELQRVFSFFEDKQNAVALGNIAEYKDYKLYVDAQLLFGSHIGIFGNTGSGKSNTLATLYTALFQQYGDRKNFKKSKFLIFDFNGEYEDAFTENKQVYHLSTRCNNKDKICIPLSVLEDMEFWSVLCEISEKTQVPFLERVLKDYQQISHCSFSGKKYLARLLQERVREVLLCCYRQGRMWEEIRENLTELLGIVLKNMILLQEQYKKMRIHCQWNELSAKESFSDMEESAFAAQTIEPLMKLLSQENLKDGDGYDFFDFAMKYRFWSETLRRRTQVDFIEPMIKRFEARLPYIRRLFLPVVEVPQGHNVEVISLLNVNGEFKKLVALLLCKIHYERQKKQGIGSLHIIMDEAHYFLGEDYSSNGAFWRTYSRVIFEELVKEGRKFGTFLTVSSQRPYDIPESILSQIHNYFIHRIVNKEDIRSIEKAVVSMEESFFDMLPVLPKGTCIFTGVASNFPVMVEMDRARDSEVTGRGTIELVRFWNGEEECVRKPEKC
jgi:DNA helicase HerA-like ATPase